MATAMTLHLTLKFSSKIESFSDFMTCKSLEIYQQRWWYDKVSEISLNCMVIRQKKAQQKGGQINVVLYSDSCRKNVLKMLKTPFFEIILPEQKFYTRETEDIHLEVYQDEEQLHPATSSIKGPLKGRCYQKVIAADLHQTSQLTSEFCCKISTAVDTIHNHFKIDKIQQSKSSQRTQNFVITGDGNIGMQINHHYCTSGETTDDPKTLQGYLKSLSLCYETSLESESPLSINSTSSISIKSFENVSIQSASIEAHLNITSHEKKSDNKRLSTGNGSTGRALMELRKPEDFPKQSISTRIHFEEITSSKLNLCECEEKQHHICNQNVLEKTKGESVNEAVNQQETTDSLDEDWFELNRDD